MFWFTKPTRPSRPGPSLRTRLRLEQLSDRAAPSSLGGDEDEPLLIAVGYDVAPTTLAAPVVVEFSAVQVQPGLYLFSGRVVLSPSPGGLTVTFGGVPSTAGMSAVTATDGTFMRTIPVRTDGSDAGTVTAMTFANGIASNTATYDISPTP